MIPSDEAVGRAMVDRIELQLDNNVFDVVAPITHKRIRSQRMGAWPIVIDVPIVMQVREMLVETLWDDYPREEDL